MTRIIIITKTILIIIIVLLTLTIIIMTKRILWYSNYKFYINWLQFPLAINC